MSSQSKKLKSQSSDPTPVTNFHTETGSQSLRGASDSVLLGKRLQRLSAHLRRCGSTRSLKMNWRECSLRELLETTPVKAITSSSCDNTLKDKAQFHDSVKSRMDVQVRCLCSILNILAGLFYLIVDQRSNLYQKLSDVDLWETSYRHLCSKATDYNSLITYTKECTVGGLDTYMNHTSGLYNKVIQPNQFWFGVTGFVKRVLRNLYLRDSPRNYHFWSGFQQLKRCLLPVPSEFVEGEMEKHKQVLGTPSTSTVSEEKRERLRCVFKKLFKNIPRYTDRQIDPASTASYNFSRASGGQRAELLWLLNVMVMPMIDGMSFDDSDPMDFKVEDLMRRQLYSPIDLDSRSATFEHEWRMFTLNVHSDLVRCEVLDNGLSGEVRSFGPLITMRDVREIEYSDINLHNQVPVECLQRLCRVGAVCEPAKVRIITAMNAPATYLCHGLQRLMHGHLRKMAPFRLIGESIKFYPDRIPALLWASGSSLMSVDYKSATDLINLTITLDCLKVVLDSCHAPGWLRDAAYAVLDKQTIEYRDELIGKGKGCFVQQENGQLMGSILSFPILCAINYACWVCAMEDVLGCPGRLSRDLSNGILINGDDALFATNPELTKVWLEWIKLVGLKLSPGKNFNHPRYGVINSCPFYLRDGHLVKLKFANVGLLMGYSKVSDDDDMPTVAIHNEAVDGFRNPETASLWFRSLHQELIKPYLVGNPGLYLPESCGGLGFLPRPKHLSSTDSFNFINDKQICRIWQVAYGIARFSGPRVKTDRPSRRGLFPRHFRTAETEHQFQEIPLDVQLPHFDVTSAGVVRGRRTPYISWDAYSDALGATHAERHYHRYQEALCWAGTTMFRPLLAIPGEAAKLLDSLSL